MESDDEDLLIDNLQCDTFEAPGLFTYSYDEATRKVTTYEEEEDLIVVELGSSNQHNSFNTPPNTFTF